MNVEFCKRGKTDGGGDDRGEGKLCSARHGLYLKRENIGLCTEQKMG